MTEVAAVALELEVLVARALWQGLLDVEELLPTYLRLAPASHPGLGDARSVDVAAVARALGALPPECFESGELLVVRRLADYGHAPSRGDLRAGVLSDGTPVLEATLGLVSVLEVAATLCLLRHEVDKAVTLMPDLRARAESGAPDYLSHLAERELIQ